MAQRYCPGVPSIVLGLKADLRPNFPTLRLGFLKESTAFTVGQVCHLTPEYRLRARREVDLAHRERRLRERTKRRPITSALLRPAKVSRSSSSLWPASQSRPLGPDTSCGREQAAGFPTCSARSRGYELTSFTAIEHLLRTRRRMTDDLWDRHRECLLYQDTCHV